MAQISVDDIDDPRLACFRELNQKNLTRQSGLFIAEGDKVVSRLVNSRFEMVSILAEPAFADRYEPLVPPGVPIYVAQRKLLAATVGFHFHRGVVACGRRRPGPDLREVLAALNSLPLPVGEGRGEGAGVCGRSSDPHPNPLPVGEGTVARWLRHDPASQGRRTIVICPAVQDPTNLGSIIRSAAAFGCAGIVLGGKCADPFSRRVLRVSMGAALHLPVIESRDLGADLRELQAADFELLATVIDPDAESLASARRGERVAILLGSEGHGLAAEWLALCHRRVTIPMELGIDSLNVAVAAAVVLYHFTA